MICHLACMVRDSLEGILLVMNNAWLPDIWCKSSEYQQCVLQSAPSAYSGMDIRNRSWSLRDIIDKAHGMQRISLLRSTPTLESHCQAVLCISGWISCLKITYSFKIAVRGAILLGTASYVTFHSGPSHRCLVGSFTDWGIC